MYKVVSFDADGTLVDHAFSHRLWGEEIPRLYAQVHSVPMEMALREVYSAFSEVGEDDPAWFSFEHWFGRLELGSHRGFVEAQRGKASIYPEVVEVLEEISGNGQLLVVNSNAPRDILEIELEPISRFFDHIFSAPSDFRRVKVDCEYYSDICFFLGIDPEEMIHVGDRWIDDVISPGKVGVAAVYLDRKGIGGEHSVQDLHQFARLLRGGVPERN